MARPEGFEPSQIPGSWPGALSVMLWAHMVGQVGLEPTTSSGNGFTIRGDTNYALLTHIYVPFQTHPVTPCFTCFLHSVWPACWLKTNGGNEGI